MNEFDDEKLIRALRSAGTAGPAFAMTPLAETTRRGRAARRRRSVLAGAGATALAAATVTAALAVPPMLEGRDAVPSPAGDPTEAPTLEPTEEPSNEADEATPMTAAEMIAANKAAVFDALPNGFVRLTEENRDDADGMAGFALAESPPATDGLPEGMSGGIGLMTFPASDPVDLAGHWCEGLTEKGAVTTECADLQVDDHVVKVQETTRSEGGRGGAYEATRTSYQQPSGGVIVLDLYAWEIDRQTTPERLAAARAWVDAMHEQIVSIVLHPSFQPTEWDERRDAEARALAADLGEGWTVLDEPPASSVHPSAELAATLPEGMDVGVLRDVLPGADLSELCAARTEDGMQREACEPVAGADVVVSYGLMVDPEHGGDGSFDMRIADVIAYHDRDDGSIVKVRLMLSNWSPNTSPDPSSPRPWLEEQVPDLVRAAIFGS
jgi:hypothetical protein